MKRNKDKYHDLLPFPSEKHQGILISDNNLEASQSIKKPGKVLYAHDGPLLRNHNHQIYGTDEVRNRYSKMGQELSYLIRIVQETDEECGKHILIDYDKFSAIEVPNFKSFIKYFAVRPKAKKIVEDAVKRHDVIIARLPSGIGSLAVKYAIKHKKPLLTEMVACTKDTYWYHSIKGKLIAYYFYYRQRAIMRNVKYCIYVTKSFLQKRYPIKGKTISCSNVCIEKVDCEMLIQRICRINNMNSSRPLILGSVGKLSMRYKGYQDIIRTIAHLKKRSIRFHYHLAGGGDDSYLRKLVRKYKLEREVTILGPLSHRDVFNFMDKIDVYVQPSRTEGLPRAMIEAMSRACPVMGSKVGGIPELVEDGISFESGNLLQIEKALLLLNQDRLLEEASRSFYKAKEYENETLVARRISFYESFLKDHHLTLKTLK